MEQRWTVTWQGGNEDSRECENARWDSLREGIEGFASFVHSGAGCHVCQRRDSGGTLRLRAPDGALLAERRPL